MAAISIKITNATYADAATACSSGPAVISSDNQTLWYNDSEGSLSALPQGGLQLYTEEALTNRLAFFIEFTKVLQGNGDTLVQEG